MREYWIVDPGARTVEVLSAGPAGWVQAATFSAEDVLASPLLPGLSIDLGQVSQTDAQSRTAPQPARTRPSPPPAPCPRHSRKCGSSRSTKSSPGDRQDIELLQRLHEGHVILDGRLGEEVESSLGFDHRVAHSVSWECRKSRFRW